MWISGPRQRCAACPSLKVPRIMTERWDAADQIVVGGVRCDKCGAQSLFTRYLTKAEKKCKQTQGAVIRSK